MQKSVVFLHTNNEQSKKDFLKIPFIISSKRIKYLWINLNKEAKALYTENF